MELKVGDKVKFLNDTGGGEVTGIISSHMVNILDEEGFEVPVLTEELLKIEENSSTADTSNSTDEKEEDTDKYDPFEEELPGDTILQSEEDPTEKVYFSFVPLNPDYPANKDLETYVINDSNCGLHYLILLKRANTYVYFASGDLEDNTKIYIKTIEKERLNEIRHFRFQLIFSKKGFFKPVAPVDLCLNLQPQKFFKSGTFVENEFFDEHAYILNLNQEKAFNDKISALTDEQIRNVIRDKEHSSDGNTGIKRRNKKPDTEEVDLHIEELVEKPGDLSNKEMLEIQMGKFQTTLNGSFESPDLKRIVFIHGIGNGRLRYEIRKYLDRHYPRLDYQDASFKEYGYGATMIFLR